MSAAAPAVELTVEQGQVEARAFRDDQGRDCVLVVGLGPGPASATIPAATPQPLTSRLGATQRTGDGGYHFTGTDICCDILE